jgi:hypothetical protein
MSDFTSMSPIAEDYTAVYIHIASQKFSILPIVASALKGSGEAEGLVLKNDGANSGLKPAKHGQDKTFEFVGLIRRTQEQTPKSYMQFCSTKYPEARKMLEKLTGDSAVSEKVSFNKPKMDFYSEDSK